MKGSSGWPACGGNQVIGPGSPTTTGRPFRRARNDTVARTCLVIPRHRVVDRSRMVFSKKILWDTTPELAANSAISLRRAKAAGPARPDVSWLSGRTACNLAGSAVLVPFKRVLSLSDRTRITSSGLDSRGRQRVRHTYVRHDRTAGEQCQPVTPLGVASGARGELLCSSMASWSTWLVEDVYWVPQYQ